ncbi:MAG: NERD domain-containing protein [Gammaproteobacteria bacterium]|nr:NERD domain-containing protein [Gammaproteobacteria bacterium]
MLGSMWKKVSKRYWQWRVRSLLERHVPDVLHNFILPGANGGLAKIDHAILSGGGILCIQVRHYSGTILGSAEDAQWRNLDGARRRRFLNPLVQSEGCRRALQKVVPDVPVKNLVVFTGAPEFRSPLPENAIMAHELDRYLFNHSFETSAVDDWDAVWLTVRAEARTDEATRKDHASQLGFI